MLGHLNIRSRRKRSRLKTPKMSSSVGEIPRWLHGVLMALLIVLPTAMACSAPRISGLMSADDSNHLIMIPLTVHIATNDGLPIIEESHVQNSIDHANEALGVYGIRVYERYRNFLPQGYNKVIQSDDRTRLAELSKHDGTVHIFFVERVTMSDPKAERGDVQRRVSGLHWRYRGLRWSMHLREYVVVSSDAPNTTLVHELGHTFDLDHKDSPENIMCSCRRKEKPTFNSDQGQQMRDGARRFIIRAEGY